MEFRASLGFLEITFYYFKTLTEFRERAKSHEEELHKVKAARSVDEVARKDLEDQLETEQHFRSLYKTQAATLQDEVDEARDRIAEVEAEAKKNHRHLQQALEVKIFFCLVSFD